MENVEDYYLNNPLPYIFFIYVLASITFNVYGYNKLQAIMIACSFFIVIYYGKKIKVASIMLLFFIIAIINNNLYYSFVPENYEEIRITQVSEFYLYGSCEGRIIRLIDINGELNKGDRILAAGNFTRKTDCSRGVIGEYKVEDYKCLKNDFISSIYLRRDKIYNKIEEKLGARKAGLITSIAFGYAEKLDNEDKEEMRALGISHAVSVSGLHMVLIYGLLKGILGNGISIIIGLLYVLFTGAASSAIRAYFMIVVMSGGLVLKRNYNPMAALALSGILILIIKPYEVFSLGFALSYLATVGIILLNKKINRSLYKFPGYIRDTMSLSVASQVFTLPIILCFFYEVSINTLFGNLIFIPIINIILILGNLTLIFINIDTIFNFILYLCHYCIKINDFLMDAFWQVNMETVYLNYTIVYFYVFVLITIYFYKKGFKRFIYLPLIALVYVFIINYNPILSIKYFNDGGLLFSYRGQRVLVSTKEVVNQEKLLAITGVNHLYRDIKRVKIKDAIIEKEGNNYVMTIEDNKYLLLVNYKNSYSNYDIIDFKSGEFGEVMVFNNRVIQY